jgi:hypothetical protein
MKEELSCVLVCLLLLLLLRDCAVAVAPYSCHMDATTLLLLVIYSLGMGELWLLWMLQQGIVVMTLAIRSTIDGEDGPGDATEFIPSSAAHSVVRNAFEALDTR